MSRLSSYDVKPEAKPMKIPLTSKIVANYAYGTRATGQFNSKNRAAANDLAWEVAA